MSRIRTANFPYLIAVSVFEVGRITRLTQWRRDAATGRVDKPVGCG